MKKMKNILILAALGIGAVGLCMGIHVYFQNWEKIMSEKDKFEMYRWPIVLLVISLTLRGIAKMADEN